MALSPHKFTALESSNDPDVNSLNTISGAVCVLYDDSGNAATLYDNKTGSNGSTAKQTDATGQVVVWVEPGEYKESINGGTQRSVVVADYVGDDPSDQRDRLGLGTAATYDVGTDSGDVMGVGAFGLGGNVTNITSGSLNDLSGTHTGFYHYTSTVTDIPSSTGGRLINMVRSTGETTQIAIGNLTAQPTMYIRNADNSGAFGDWVEYYHSANSTDPTEYGIGSQAVTTVTDWDDIPSDFRGIIRIGYNADNTPTGVDPLYVYQGVFMGSQYDPLLVLWGADGTKTLKQYTLKVELSGDSWSGAKTFEFKAESYHSGNTNFNEFYGYDLDSATAVGASTTTMRVFLPINSYSAPAGISIEGEFNIRTMGNVLVASNVASNMSFAAVSSCRLAEIYMSGLTGISENQVYRLQGASASSKITVNF